jgi:hypothetical protein
MIEVRIDRDLYRTRFNENDVLLGIYTLEQLREAGIPVEGVLFVRGVSRGRLVIEAEDDLVGNEWIYRWVP